MGIFSKDKVLLIVAVDYWRYANGMRTQVKQTMYVPGDDEEDALFKLTRHIRKKLDGDNINTEVLNRIFVGALTDGREVFVP